MSSTLTAPPATKAAPLRTLHTQATACPTPSHHLPHTVPSESLLCGHKSVEISHHGTIYRLQATKLGKLILTK